MSLVAEESICAITQIAVTELKASEVAEAHVYEDILNGFYVLDGRLDIKLNDEIINCTAEDYVWMKSSMIHILRAVDDVRILTMVCEL
jgi:glyoxylate utilization-related uncharacterized protein